MIMQDSSGTAEYKQERPFQYSKSQNLSEFEHLLAQLRSNSCFCCGNLAIVITGHVDFYFVTISIILHTPFFAYLA